MSDDDTSDTLEALFYKIDVEGLEYTLENYFDLFTVLPAEVQDIAERAADLLQRLTAKLEAVREEHGIEAS